MNANVKKLYNNKWLSLRSVTFNGLNVGEYVYSHMDRSDGKIVAILPFEEIVYEAEFASNRNYIVRIEMTPAWIVSHNGNKTNFINSITGAVESDSVEKSALIELEEEAGIIVEESNLIPLGVIPYAKSSDTMVHMFAVDITGLSTVAAKPDSELEALEGVKTVSEEYLLVNADDVLLYTMLNKLNIVKPKKYSDGM